MRRGRGRRLGRAEAPVAAAARARFIRVRNYIYILSARGRHHCLGFRV